MLEWYTMATLSNFQRNVMKEKSTSNRYTCNEYREEMILAGLRKQLAQKDLSENERQKIKKAIRELEEAMGF